jgi:hypothetical protein
LNALRNRSVGTSLKGRSTPRTRSARTGPVRFSGGLR